MISGILLSAGLSSRFGSPKALAVLNGIRVIEHIQNTLNHSLVSEVVIVLGSHANEIQPFVLKHKKVKYVYNKNYNLGQTSSFKIGLENISNNALGVMLLPVDYPLIKFKTINLLLDYFLIHKPSVLIPTYQNKKGHPPIFGSHLTKIFLNMDNSVGLNVLMKQINLQSTLLPVNDNGVLLTFNTLDEFASLKKIYHETKKLSS